MSARDMFRNASRLFGKQGASSAGTSSATKTTTTASTTKSTTKTTPAPQPEPEPVTAENRDPGPATVPDRGEAQVINAALEPDKIPLGLRYSIVKQQPNGAVGEVDPASEFRSGDRIRLTVESNDSAYLYLVLLGSSGKWSVLFPSPAIAGGNNHIEPGHRYSIPAQHWFAFDEQVGEEKLFIFLSRQPQDDLEELIYSLRKGPDAQPLAQPVSEKQLLAQALPVDPELIGQLRETVYARDLVFEKVDDSGSAGAPGSQGEKAIYIVNRTGDDDSRVLADVTLVHR